MRRSASLSLIAALAACSVPGGDTVAVEVEDEDRIDCALAGAAAFTRDCRIERSTSEGKDVLVVRHPDGGFRRFEVGAAGQSLETADGIEDALVRDAGALLEVKVAHDRYRLPPPVRGDAAPR